MVQSREDVRSLTIGKLAAAGGVGVETIRFYQRRRLIKTPARNGLIRRYGVDDVRRLRFIRQAQSAGFTLEEIRELLQLEASNDRARARGMANARVEALEAKIAELQQARDVLKRLRARLRDQRPGAMPDTHVLRAARGRQLTLRPGLFAANLDRADEPT